MNLEQAIQFVLEPCSDSELSELESDDDVVADQSQLFVEDRTGEDKVVDIAEDNEFQSDTEETEENETLHEKQKNDSSPRQFRWHFCVPPHFDNNYHGKDFSLPPHNFDTLTLYQIITTSFTPYPYFIKFWNDISWNDCKTYKYLWFSKIRENHQCNQK